MRIIFAILFFISLLLVLIFLFQNGGSLGATVNIGYNIRFFVIEPVPVPIWVLVLLTFAAGVITTFFLEMIGYFKTRSNIVTQKKKIKSLEKEIQDRRTVFTEETKPAAEPKKHIKE